MKKQLALFCLLGCLSGMAQTMVPAEDKKFAETAVDAGMKEVKLGQLALANGSSQKIKDLGQQMVDDHSKANSELMAIASKKGITLPSSLSAKEQKCYDDMAKKTGAAFDKEYAKCMVEDHKKAIELFKKEAKDGKDADMKNFAQGKIPTLEHHKMMSEDAWNAVK